MSPAPKDDQRVRLPALRKLVGKRVTIYTLPGKAFTGELLRCDETTAVVDDGNGGETIVMLENATGVTAERRAPR